MTRRADLTGQQFGQLTAIRYEGNLRWLCRCSCGVEKSVRAFQLKSKDKPTRHCGCLTSSILKEKLAVRRIDYIGATNGFLECIGEASIHPVNGRTLKVLCRACKSEVELRTGAFERNKSCGCMNSILRLKHGQPINGGKVCASCGEEKSLDSFYTKNGKPNGYCKACHQADSAVRYQKRRARDG